MVVPNLDADLVSHIYTVVCWADEAKRPVDERLLANLADPNLLRTMAAVCKTWKMGVVGACQTLHDFDALQSLTYVEAIAGDRNLFVTGAAGVGKSVLLQRICDSLRRLDDGHAERGALAVVAPTGIAALNVGGSTICSYGNMRLVRGSSLAVGYHREHTTGAESALSSSSSSGTRSETVTGEEASIAEEGESIDVRLPRAMDPEFSEDSKDSSSLAEAVAQQCVPPGKFLGTISMNVGTLRTVARNAALGDDAIERWAEHDYPESSSVQDLHEDAKVDGDGMEADYEDGDRIMRPVPSVVARCRHRRLQTLVVDEISMVDEYLLRQLEFVVGRAKGVDRPFDASAGRNRVRLILVGDFGQLPVVLPRDTLKARAVAAGTLPEFLFQGTMWRELRLSSRRLTTVRRTTHPEYVEILRRLHEGEPLAGALYHRLLALTRRRLEPGEEEEQLALFGRNGPGKAEACVRDTVPCAENWNHRKMRELRGDLVTLPAVVDVSVSATNGPVRGDEHPMPLTLKAGCTVVVTRNQMQGAASVADGTSVANGTLGWFVGAELVRTNTNVPVPANETAAAATRARNDARRYQYDSTLRRNGATDWASTVPSDGRVEQVLRIRIPDPKDPQRSTDYLMRRRHTTTWRRYRDPIDGRKKRSVHVRSQYPVRPAMGITIHKAQGKTIRQRVLVRVDQAWEYGQQYVSLSRVSDPKMMRLVGQPPQFQNKRMRMLVRTVNEFHASIPSD